MLERVAVDLANPHMIEVHFDLGNQRRKQLPNFPRLGFLEGVPHVSEHAARLPRPFRHPARCGLSPLALLRLAGLVGGPARPGAGPASRRGWRRFRPVPRKPVRLPGQSVGQDRQSACVAGHRQWGRYFAGPPAACGRGSAASRLPIRTTHALGVCGQPGPIAGPHRHRCRDTRQSLACASSDIRTVGVGTPLPLREGCPLSGPPQSPQRSKPLNTYW